MPKKKKAAIFARELPEYPAGEIMGVYWEDKWRDFTDLINSCADDTDVLYVPSPETIGDDYLELLVNLSKLAEAGIKLKLGGPAKTIKVKTYLGPNDTELKR